MVCGAAKTCFKRDEVSETCLKQNAFFSHRGRSRLGRKIIRAHVAVVSLSRRNTLVISLKSVVLNRVAHGFANTPCNVIYQTTIVDDVKVCQFSWVCENKGEPNKNSYRYKVAQQVAFDVMATDKHKDVIPNSVLFFHNLTVTPLWPYTEVVKIGNHIFYSKGKKKAPVKKLGSSDLHGSIVTFEADPEIFAQGDNKIKFDWIIWFILIFLGISQLKTLLEGTIKKNLK